MSTYWRLCGFDSRQFAGYSGEAPWGGFLCQRHTEAMFAGHDPQPYRPPVIGEREVQGRVRLHVDPLRSDWLVLTRDGDTLTLRRLGFPDSEPVTTSIGATYPAEVHAAIVRGLASKGAP